MYIFSLLGQRTGGLGPP